MNNRIKNFIVLLITAFLGIAITFILVSFFKGNYKTYSVTVRSDSAIGTLLNRFLLEGTAEISETKTTETKFINPNKIERTQAEKDQLLAIFEAYANELINLPITDKYSTYNNKFGEHTYSFYFPNEESFKIYDEDAHSGSIKLFTTNLSDNYRAVTLDVFPYEYYERQSTAIVFDGQDIRDYYNEVFAKQTSYAAISKEEWSILRFSNNKTFYYKLVPLRIPTYTFIGVVNNKPFSLMYQAENYKSESAMTPKELLVILQTIEIN